MELELKVAMSILQSGKKMHIFLLLMATGDILFLPSHFQALWTWIVDQNEYVLPALL